MTSTQDDALLEQWMLALAAAGIDDARLLSRSSVDVASFGNADATVQWGELVLFLVRDRGQLFVELSSVHDRKRRHRLDDVALAFGWRSLDAIMTRKEPEPLADELRVIAVNRSELERAFETVRLVDTNYRIRRAAATRARAFLVWLNNLPR